MRRRSEAYRTTSDYGDGKIFESWRFHILSFQYYGTYAQKEGLCGGVALRGNALCVDAAFVDQEPDQAIHRRIIGAADQRRHLTFLADQTRQDQAVQMMGERRSRDAQFFLQAADRQAVIAGANECAIDLEPGRIAASFTQP
jgi:hypothetical protein